ncbi:hypothetical protein P153DRAFT_146008 [Dothidotthia symphoricarpi CBS 119687]|uniref:Uncharacterized protein n=1 Tax=Dothidotthia symphoricarpi CBS 119687 TaxID=1392245 RepID=A0A6A5ZY08_9PLEO|nr:uncharacterized protein P153DRAFT_146008 [Dothidotthia symphoricarpi CBS 119687]KAF2123784.1 hypothetical protein P153DRAFT_146008 [Dothidotthia symphoricarpi CBS 119687]
MRYLFHSARSWIGWHRLRKETEWLAEGALTHVPVQLSIPILPHSDVLVLVRAWRRLLLRRPSRQRARLRRMRGSSWSIARYSLVFGFSDYPYLLYAPLGPSVCIKFSTSTLEMLILLTVSALENAVLNLATHSAIFELGLVVFHSEELLAGDPSR